MPLSNENIAKKRSVLYILADVFHTMSNIANKAAICFSIAAGTIMFVSLICGVFSRYILLSPFLWTEEVARFGMIWLTFNGASIIMKRREMVKFRMLTDIIPESFARILRLLCSLSILAFLVVFLVVGYEALLINMNIHAAATRIARFWPSLGLYLGAIIMIFHTIDMIFEQLLGINRSADGDEGDT